MLHFTAAQIDTWLASLIFPLARLLGLLAAAPLFGNRGIPLRIRVALGLVVTLAIAPALPPAPTLPTSGWLALAMLARELVLGLAMGFVLRLVFAAVDLAGELIGLQMGFSFASFYDPHFGTTPAVTQRFLGLLAILIFLGLDGHLMLIDIAVHSFAWLPVGMGPLPRDGWAFIAHYGITVFAAGLLLALPLIAALLIAHLAIGVLNRAAPQFNLFTVGFQVTLGTGILLLPLALNAFGPALHKLLEQGLDAVGQLLRALASTP
jgi:flagellar biosynthesis protein FliR